MNDWTRVAPHVASGDGLAVDGLVKDFGGRRAVDGLTFTLARGTILGLLGPNGAGKTTSLLCLCGLMRPDTGTISFAGERLGADRGHAISLIPETPEVYPMLTVWEHLAFVAASARLRPGWETRGEALLERFALASERDALGHALSKGMRQKTLIAATVLADAPVLLLDEPMVGLDPRGQRELRELLRDLARSGTTIVVSTHLIESAELLCDRVAILKGGRTMAEGAIVDLRAADSRGLTLEELFLDITA